MSAELQWSAAVAAQTALDEAVAAERAVTVKVLREMADLALTTGGQYWLRFAANYFERGAHRP